MQGVPRCTKALNKSMCILSFDSQMEQLAPDARRSGSAAEGSMKKKASGNEELSVFHCPQHSVLWPNCLTPWFRCLAALCDGDHFWKLLEALLVCFQDSKRTMIVCVSLFAKSWMGLDGYIYIIVWQGRRLEILVHTDQCVSSFAAQARAQARADRPNDSGEGELGSYSLQIRANSESRHTIMRHIETFETYWNTIQMSKLASSNQSLLTQKLHPWDRLWATPMELWDQVLHLCLLARVPDSPVYHPTPGPHQGNWSRLRANSSEKVPLANQRPGKAAMHWQPKHLSTSLLPIYKIIQGPSKRLHLSDSWFHPRPNSSILEHLVVHVCAICFCRSDEVVFQKFLPLMSVGNRAAPLLVCP